MKRILIIGASGAGKTTLARMLGLLYDIKVYHLDRLFWQRSWGNKDFDVRFDILQEIIQEQSWIIEGNYAYSIRLAWAAADTIIFLDLPLTLCLERVIQRHYLYHGLPRRDLPMQCTDNFDLQRAIKLISFSMTKKKTLKKRLLQTTQDKVVCLHSPGEVDTFVNQQRQKILSQGATKAYVTNNVHYPQLVSHSVQAKPVPKTYFHVFMLFIYNSLVFYHQFSTLPFLFFRHLGTIWQRPWSTFNTIKARLTIPSMSRKPRFTSDPSTLTLESPFDSIQQSPIPQ